MMSNQNNQRLLQGDSSHNNFRLTDSQRAEFQTAFDIFDKNGDRRISTRELAIMIHSATGPNANFTIEDIQKLIQEVDTDAGTIDFEEFVQMMQGRLQEVDVQEEIVEAFRVFDKERTGFVAIDDVKKVLLKMGDGNVTKEEVNEILRELDPEGTQAFKYEEFVR